MYICQATVNWTDRGGYTHTRQVPTFHLDENVLGIINAKHAAEIAKDILRSFPTPEDSSVNVSTAKLS